MHDVLLQKVVVVVEELRMATDGQNETVRAQRQSEMGSDEGAMEERRRVQKMIREGEEHAVPGLLEVLGGHLAGPSRRTEPAAMKAAEGLAKLCNIGELTSYPVNALGTSLTVEQILIRAVQDGSNRLQCSATDALGLIGTPDVRGHLKARSTEDKSARVRARAKIALRRLELRGGQTLSNPQTPEALGALLEAACEPTGFELKQVEKTQELKENAVVSNLFEILVAPSEGRTQTVFVKTGEQRSNDQVGLVDDRGLAQGLMVHSRYVVLYTPCGPATPAVFEQALKMNALRLSPDSFKNSPHGFSQGSLGVYRKELCMFETLQMEALSVSSLRHSVRVLALVGDEIEKQLTKGGDAR